MIISEQEKRLGVITLLVLLFAALFMFFNRQKDKIDQLRSQRREREALYAEYSALISQNQVWNEAYEKDADLMPVFEPDRQVQTYWLGVLERLASESELSIIRRQVGEERQEGDVYELPIECKEWEGSLESLVKFLYAVHAEGAMLDVRKLFIRPGSSSGTGRPAKGLRGSFTLHCAFLRSESAAQTPNEIGDRR